MRVQHYFEANLNFLFWEDEKISIASMKYCLWNTKFVNGSFREH